MLTKWIRSSTAAAVAALFANGEAGAVFIAQKPAEWGGVADLVTMYQDNLGTTPVTALEQTVGLHLDTRPILLGPELVAGGATTVGGSDNTTTNVTNTSFTQSGGVTSTSSYVPLTGLRVGATYQTSARMAAISGGIETMLVRTNGVGGGAVIANLGAATVPGAVFQPTQFVATATTHSLGIGNTVAGTSNTIDRVTVREVIAAPNTVGQPLRSAQLAPDIGVAANYTASGAGAALSNPVAGQLKVLNGGAAEASAIIPNVTVIPGAFYEVTATLVSRAGTGLGFVVVGDVNMPLTGVPGTYRSIIKPAVGTGIRVAVGTATLNDAVTISALSVKMVYGNHRSQSSAPARARLSARYNKVTARNANPVDLTNVTKSGDAAATLTLVNDAAALAAAGLSGICTLGNVYKLDNSAGATNASATFGGTTGNTNTQRCSVYWRGSGLANIGTTSNVSGNTALTAAYAQFGFTATSSAVGNQEFLIAQPGAVVYFILPDLRESCYSYLPTPQTIIGTGATAADYDDTGFPARLVRTGAQGDATGNVDFSGSPQAQTFWGGARLSDAAFGVLMEVGANVNTVAQTFAAYSNNAGGFGCYTFGTGTQAIYQSAAYPAPSAKVLSIQHDVSAATVATQVVARINGVLDQTGPAGPTTPAAAFTAQPLNFGSRNNLGTGAGTLNFIGDEFISIVRGGATPTTDIIASVERFVGQKMLVYL